MKMVKQSASLSLDLDNKWSYMKTHGDSGWESFPSYLDVLVPRVLDCLKRHNLTITFFIVGQDSALEKNHALLRSIAAAGHEIGNHSFKHEPWLHLYSEEQIKSELTKSEEHIERVTGQKPVGFRGPGFSLSYKVIRELAQRGYLYDTTTFPTFLIPLARTYYFWTAKFSKEEKAQRRFLGGSFREGFRPIKPYCWQIGGKTLLEIPVTTMPFFKMPIHLSYLFCLSNYSRSLALRYFDIAIWLCHLTDTQPSIILHPTDFLGCDDTEDLSFFPAMTLGSTKKMELVDHILYKLCREFKVLTLRQHAHQLEGSSSLPVIEPNLLVA